MAEGLAYELTLAPVCAHVGEALTATIRLRPDRTVGSLMAVYADGSYEQPHYQQTPADGVIKYTWVAKPVPGEGRLATQAQDTDTNERGTKIVAFRVVEVNGRC